MLVSLYSITVASKIYISYKILLSVIVNISLISVFFLPAQVKLLKMNFDQVNLQES
jgi:hypothetical protein